MHLMQRALAAWARVRRDSREKKQRALFMLAGKTQARAALILKAWHAKAGAARASRDKMARWGGCPAALSVCMSACCGCWLLSRRRQQHHHERQHQCQRRQEGTAATAAGSTSLLPLRCGELTCPLTQPWPPLFPWRLQGEPALPHERRAVGVFGLAPARSRAGHAAR
jgi:hypothetical protein